MNIQLKKVNSDAIIPTKGTPRSNAYDLYAVEDSYIERESLAVVDTGIALAIPQGYVGLICPRSGLAAKKYITVLNAPGVIDEDFRGSIKVIMMNHRNIAYSVSAKDKIAQILFVKSEDVEFMLTEQLDETVRGEGGFGSTGIS